MDSPKRRHDRGNVLVGVLVSIVLMGFVVSLAGRQLLQGSLASLRARSHTEAVAVASWKAAEFRVSGCPTAPIEPVIALGPDELSTPNGFSVTCEELYIEWTPIDPPPTTLPGTPPLVVTVRRDPNPPLSGVYTSIVTVTVNWDARGYPRSLQQSIVREPS